MAPLVGVSPYELDRRSHHVQYVTAKELFFSHVALVLNLVAAVLIEKLALSLKGSRSLLPSVLHIVNLVAVLVSPCLLIKEFQPVLGILFCLIDCFYFSTKFPVLTMQVPKL
jgi:hypothetical protein